jgi:hypothetical protein
MHALSDEALLEMVGSLGAKDLASLALVSKSLYCFSTCEDTWKALVLMVGH